MVICSAQFLSFSQLHLSKIEVWITCTYSNFFVVKVNMAFLSLKFSSLVHHSVNLSVTFLSAVFISVRGHVVVRA